MINVFDATGLRKSLCLVLLTMGLFFAFPTQRAHAMDPVTIAILTPVAIAVAQKAKPYVIKGLKNGSVMLFRMFKDFVRMFLFPLGFFQCTLGAPFGYFPSGVRNIIEGTGAFFKWGLRVLLLPVACFGIGPK